MRDAESRAAKEHRSCAGRNHFLAELSRTCFEKSLIYQLLSFAFDDQSGGLLVLLKKKKEKKLRLSRSLPFSLSARLSSIYAPFFLRKKRKKGQRDDLPAAERQINARSGIDLLACMLSPPSRSEKRSFYSTKRIYVRKARVVIQQMTDRRGVFISLHGTSPLWGCGTPSLRWGGGGGTSRRNSLGLWHGIPRLGELPFLRGFSL